MEDSAMKTGQTLQVITFNIFRTFSAVSLTLLFSQTSPAQTGSCTGTCSYECGSEVLCSGVPETCSTVPKYCTASKYCANDSKTQSDLVNKLPSGPIKNSSINDNDGCPDNYPHSQTKLPFEWEGSTYKNLPTKVAYTIRVCKCP